MSELDPRAERVVQPPFGAVDVCVIGSANLDVVATVGRLPGPGETLLGHDYHEYPGGKGLNQAVAAARSGARTAMFGALGDDDAGRHLRGVLRADGIDDTAVVDVGRSTGRAVILVDDAGENSIVVVPGANGLVAPPDRLPACRVVLAQLEVPPETVEAAFRLGRAGGATTVLNPAPAAPLPHSLLEVCDVIVPNEHEVELLGGVEQLLALGCSTVIVTCGGRGVQVHSAGASWHQEPFDVEVVDTTGAGDAFCGALAARLASGESLGSAVRWAAAAGALATTVAGAVPAQPAAATIDKLLGD